MTQLSKVVWSEGMHLSQHHFQTQTRYFEDTIHFALAQLFRETHGLGAVELDADALRNGTAALVHARGVMPDGLPFDVPRSDPAPAPRDLRDVFSPTQESHLLLLGVPPYRPDGANAGENGGARYVTTPVSRFDETSGRDERPVPVGRKNLRLLLDHEAHEGEVLLPLARVRRDGSGHFVFDEGYIPPVLQVGASEALVRLLARIVDMLEAKGAALAAARAGGGGPTGDVATLWLLHAVHSSLAPLRQHLLSRRSRPDQLFTELARLAGALCTFALDAHPRQLAAYDPDDLAGCFGALERHIARHLGVAAPAAAVRIPLAPAAPFLYNGEVTDRRCLGERTRWLFGVASGLGVADTITKVPQLVKLCSAKFTPELVRRAYPGLMLQYVPVPPASVAPQAGMQYFEVVRHGPCWDTIVQTAAVGIYVPDAFPDAQVELRVVLDD
jgi:type VI secretion system protein ImpJ